MIVAPALTFCAIVIVNCAFASAAVIYAYKTGVALTFMSGPARAILVAGTLVEAFLLVGQRSGGTEFIVIITFGAVVVAAACDAVCGYVFDVITLPCLLVVTSAVAMNGDVLQAVLGIAAAAGALLTLFFLTRGRGLGLGDVKLAACIGGCLGVAGAVEALGAAFVIGGVYAAYLLASKRTRFGTQLPFAPYLAAGFTVALLRAGLR